MDNYPDEFLENRPTTSGAVTYPKQTKPCKTHVNRHKAETFDHEIEDVFKNKGKSKFNRIIISKVPDIYRTIGMHGDEFVVKRGSINRHRTKAGHLETTDEWKELADNIDIPIGYLVETATKYHIYFNIKNRNGETMMAVVEEKQTGKYSRTELLITVFYKKHFEQDVAAGIVKKINQPSVQ